MPPYNDHMNLSPPPAQHPPNFLPSIRRLPLPSTSSMGFQLQLINHLLNDTIGDVCKWECNPSRNSTFCIAYCWDICPSICPPPNFNLPPNPDPPFYKRREPNNQGPILITLLVIGLIVTFFYVLRTLRRRAPSLETRTREAFPDEEHGPVLDHPVWHIRSVGLQASDIDSIAAFKYKKGDSLVQVADCSICLSEFQEDEILRLLPKCSHAFHIPCIDTWLRSHTNCPVCRAPIVPKVNSGEAHVDTLGENREAHNSSREVDDGIGVGIGAGESEPARKSISSSEESASTRGKEELDQGSDSISSSRRMGGGQRFLRLVESSPIAIGSSLHLQTTPIFFKSYTESSLPKLSTSSSHLQSTPSPGRG